MFRTVELRLDYEFRFGALVCNAYEFPDMPPNNDDLDEYGVPLVQFGEDGPCYRKRDVFLVPPDVPANGLRHRKVVDGHTVTTLQSLMEYMGCNYSSRGDMCYLCGGHFNYYVFWACRVDDLPFLLLTRILQNRCDEGITDDNGNYICPKCATNASACGICGDTVSQDRDFCASCVELYLHTKGWDFKPYRWYPITKGDKRAPLLGLEFELPIGDEPGLGAYFDPTEVENEYSRKFMLEVSSLLGVPLQECAEKYLFTKHDGSVSPGIEVVLQPMTKAVIDDTRLVQIIDEASARANPGGGVNYGETHNVGLHVHLDRRFLTNLTAYKIGAFCYSNTLLMQEIAKRRLEYHEYCNTQFRINTHWSLAKRILRSPFRDDRYVLLNYTNERTLEFRMFAGSTEKYDVDVALEFVLFMREWASQKAIHDISVDAWAKLLYKRKKVYPALSRFIQSLPQLPQADGLSQAVKGVPARYEDQDEWLAPPR